MTEGNSLNEKQSNTLECRLPLLRGAHQMKVGPAAEMSTTPLGAEINNTTRCLDHCRETMRYIAPWLTPMSARRGTNAHQSSVTRGRLVVIIAYGWCISIQWPSRARHATTCFPGKQAVQGPVASAEGTGQSITK